VVAVIPLGSAGLVRDMEVATVADGRSVLYLTSSDDRFHAVSVKSRELLWSTRVGVDPRGFSATPNQDEVYVANAGDGTVSVVDLATHSVTSTILVGERPLDVAIQGDGSRAYVAMGTGTVIPILDTFAKTILQRLDIGSASSSIALSPEGGQMYIARMNPSALSTLSASDGKVLTEIRLSGQISALAGLQTGLFVYARTTDPATVVQVSTTNATAIPLNVGKPSEQADPAAIALSPDSTRLFFTQFASHRIGVLTVPYSPPGAPKHITARTTANTSKSARLRVRWQAPTSTGTARKVLGYQTEAVGTTSRCVTRKSSCTLGDLRPGKRYRVRVRARSAVGFGPWATIRVRTSQPHR
jgi:YVTN family beta-propeller protein